MIIGSRCRIVEREIIHVELKTAIVLDMNQLLNVVQEARLTVGSHAHDFILALVHFEAEERRKRGVQQS